MSLGMCHGPTNVAKGGQRTLQAKRLGVWIKGDASSMNVEEAGRLVLLSLHRPETVTASLYEFLPGTRIMGIRCGESLLVSLIRYGDPMRIGSGRGRAVEPASQA